MLGGVSSVDAATGKTTAAPSKRAPVAATKAKPTVAKAPVNKEKTKRTSKKGAADSPSGASRAAQFSPELGAIEVMDDPAIALLGRASFYSNKFNGRRTSTGERHDNRLFTAASNHFPLGGKVVVHRLDTERCAIVRVNDRMHGRHVARVIDVTRSVAESLNMVRSGVVLVRVVPYVPGQALDCMGSEARETLGNTGLRLPTAMPLEGMDQSR
jgi:rare lipoprotein A